MFLLGQIRWQFFGTLTFKSERLPERVRLGLWFALLRRAAKHFHRHFPKLPWCLRQEDGETTGRRHFHFLLAGLPPDAVNPQTCFWLMAHWENLGGGMARIALIDPRLNAAGYLTKTGQGSPDAGDRFVPHRLPGSPTPLVRFSADFVTRRPQITSDMRPPRALSAEKVPARPR